MRQTLLQSYSIPQPEKGYPLWDGDYEQSMASESVCPVSLLEMTEYMNSCHFHYSLSETPTKFTNFKLREQFDFGSREFWVWSCEDSFDRIWDIIVGRGETPIYGKTGNHLWMHGEYNTERHETSGLVAREYPEHNNSLGKAN